MWEGCSHAVRAEHARRCGGAVLLSSPPPCAAFTRCCRHPVLPPPPQVHTLLAVACSRMEFREFTALLLEASVVCKIVGHGGQARRRPGGDPAAAGFGCCCCCWPMLPAPLRLACRPPAATVAVRLQAGADPSLRHPSTGLTPAAEVAGFGCLEEAALLLELTAAPAGPWTLEQLGWADALAEAVRQPCSRGLHRGSAAASGPCGGIGAPCACSNSLAHYTRPPPPRPATTRGTTLARSACSRCSRCGARSRRPRLRRRRPPPAAPSWRRCFRTRRSRCRSLLARWGPVRQAGHANGVHGCPALTRFHHCPCPCPATPHSPRPCAAARGR